jgi:hypothetical protein
MELTPGPALHAVRNNRCKVVHSNKIIHLQMRMRWKVIEDCTDFEIFIKNFYYLSQRWLITKVFLLKGFIDGNCFIF